MKKVIRKLAKRNKFIIGLYILTIVAYIVSFTFFTISVLNLTGIETLIRYFVLIFFFLYLLIYILFGLSKILKTKYKRFILHSVFSLILVVGFSIGSYMINIVYGGLSSIGESGKIVYTSNLITMADTELDKDANIGMISNEDDIEGNELAKKLLEKENLTYKVETYDDYLLMIDMLYEGELDGVFVPSNYISIFGSEEGLEQIGSDTKIVFSYSEERENTDKRVASTKGFDEPLTFLIMGVDSETDGLNADAPFNGDTLMMVTFNPTTMNATMFSIPRDTLVPIACNNNAVAKINSSAGYGTNCVIDTVENFSGVAIDYYVKINFKGVVDLVDAIGGIEVNVEEPDFNTYGDNQVCEQDSNREFGKSLVCMDTGLQTLNGEQALAYSRNRHQYLLSDLDRNRHQQEVVTAIANKMLEDISLDTIQSLFNTIEKNIVTNMSVDQMFSAYDVMKDALLTSLNGSEIVNIEKSYLEVYNLAVYSPSSGRYSSSLGYYKDSLADITKMMNVNLELEEPVIEKTFSFSANEGYEAYVAGKNKKSQQTVTLLPSFIGESKSEAQSFCSKNGITCNFSTVDSNNDNYNSGVGSDLIGRQSVSSGVMLSSVRKIDFYINGEIISQKEPVEEEKEEEKEDPDIPGLPGEGEEEKPDSTEGETTDPPADTTE